MLLLFTVGLQELLALEGIRGFSLILALLDQPLLWHHFPAASEDVIYLKIDYVLYNITYMTVYTRLDIIYNIYIYIYNIYIYIYNIYIYIYIYIMYHVLSSS